MAKNEKEQVLTEQSNVNSANLDRLNALDIATLMNNEDQQVALAVKKELPCIAAAIDMIVEAFRHNGRLIYLGAGTSGRLGVLDASECPPTFGVAKTQVIGLIAGGETALRNAVEGAEDDAQSGADELLNIQLNPNDVVIGIAVSGSTPYVVGGLNYAKQIGAKTIAISSNPNSLISQIATLAITPLVGAEVLTGSSRLKAGTAQKMILNILSTASMILLGKCYKNFMVDLQATNHKLRMRAKKIVIAATDVDQQRAEAVLQATHYDVKLAIMMILTGKPQPIAKQLLAHNSGYLYKALAQGK